MPLRAGSTLKETFRLEREIGSGAMGTVWLARHLSLDTDVAVKVLHGRSDTVEGRARFEREARAIARIESPHVVKVFDYGITADGEPWYAMELLRGEDLRAHIERVGPLGAAATATIVAQVCRGLGAAHKCELVHRDVKPANVFLLEVDGETFVKVLDFGVAKHGVSGGAELGGVFGADMTSTGALVGTPYYMSPEQVLDPRRVDHRSDLWSVGIVAYACLTASVPFQGETIGALSVAIHAGAFTPPSELTPDLPPGTDAWMRRALAHEPEDRFQSARELAAALSDVARGATDSAGPREPSGEVRANVVLGAAGEVETLDGQSRRSRGRTDSAAPLMERFGAGATERAAREDEAVPSRAAARARSEPRSRSVLYALGGAGLVAAGVLLGSRFTNRPQASTSAVTTDAEQLRSSTTDDARTPPPPSVATPDTTASSTTEPTASAPAPSATAVASSAASGATTPPTGAPSEAELRQGILACWKSTEGGKPDTAASALMADLWFKGGPRAPVVESPAFTNPQFATCANAAIDSTWGRMAKGASIRVDVALPGVTTGPPFPTPDEVRAAVLQCWSNTGGSTGAEGGTVKVRISHGGYAVDGMPAAKTFRACVTDYARTVFNRGTFIDRVEVTMKVPSN